MTNKSDQVDEVIKVVFADYPEYYDALGNMPSRVSAALLHMIGEGHPMDGYHFKILQAAYRQYSKGSGVLSSSEPPFDIEP